MKEVYGQKMQVFILENNKRDTRMIRNIRTVPSFLQSVVYLRIREGLAKQQNYKWKKEINKNSSLE